MQTNHLKTKLKALPSCFGILARCFVVCCGEDAEKQKGKEEEREYGWLPVPLLRALCETIYYTHCVLIAYIQCALIASVH
jgi:hypothetical protein